MLDHVFFSPPGKGVPDTVEFVPNHVDHKIPTTPSPGLGVMLERHGHLGPTDKGEDWREPVLEHVPGMLAAVIPQRIPVINGGIGEVQDDRDPVVPLFVRAREPACGHNVEREVEEYNTLSNQFLREGSHPVLQTVFPPIMGPESFAQERLVKHPPGRLHFGVDDLRKGVHVVVRKPVRRYKCRKVMNVKEWKWRGMVPGNRVEESFSFRVMMLPEPVQ